MILIRGQHISEITCKTTKTLGFLRRNLALAPRHTKEVAYKTLGEKKKKKNVSGNPTDPVLFGIPIMKLRLRRWRRCRGLLPGGPAGDGGTPVASVKCYTNLSGHPWSPAWSGPP